uniref:Protein kinase domain-containing protein n=1 Tax=Panagrolaimus sp. ES5 TaxID=591445 RepID=A0AC34GY39_9BILA
MGKPKSLRQTEESKASISSIKKKGTKNIPSTSTPAKKVRVDEYTELNEEEEEPESYNSIGFMKVDLGETIEGYTIIRKTGYGNFSTVWLGYDMKKHKFAALKISRAKPAHITAAYTEQMILQTIRKRAVDHPGYDKVVHILNQFDIRREGKLHPCTVFEPLGSSLLSKLYKSKNGIELPAVQKIARQMLLALQYLHEKCLLIHTDIKPENALVTMSKKQMYQITEQVKDDNFVGAGFGCNLKKSERKKLKRDDIKRLKNIYTEICSHAIEVDPVSVAQSGSAFPVTGENDEIEDWELEGSSDEENNGQGTASKEIKCNMGYVFPSDKPGSECLRFQSNDKRMQVYDEIMDPAVNIKIIDIGCALFRDRAGRYQVTTLEYRAPEVVCECVVTPAVDIWSLGCTLFELATSEYFLHPESEIKKDVEIQLYEQMIACLGPFPKKLYADGRKYSIYFDPDGSYFREIEPGKDVLSRLISYGYSKEEISLFNDFLHQMLQYDPLKRATASQCLQHPFLKTPLS